MVHLGNWNFVFISQIFQKPSINPLAQSDKHPKLFPDCYIQHMRPIFEKGCLLPWTKHFTNKNTMRANCTSNELDDFIITSSNHSSWLTYNIKSPCKGKTYKFPSSCNAVLTKSAVLLNLDRTSTWSQFWLDSSNCWLLLWPEGIWPCGYPLSAHILPKNGSWGPNSSNPSGPGDTGFPSRGRIGPFLGLFNHRLLA